MDPEKASLEPGAPSPPHTGPHEPARRHLRRLAGLAAVSYIVLHLLAAIVVPIHTPDVSSVQPSLHADPSRVALEAHIMQVSCNVARCCNQPANHRRDRSKCPDARDCLQDLILPTMQQVSAKVNFTLSYIGNVNDDGRVQCMHGDEECMGNMIELCVADLYPDPKIYLGFTMCLFNDYKQVPQQELVNNCALEHGVETDRLDQCIQRDDGQYSMDLLRQSIRRSKAANVTYSCTIRLEDEIRCIRDAGTWKNCDAGSRPQDLIADVDRRFHSLAHHVKHACFRMWTHASQLLGSNA